jgi:AcrR family transcriptional regulator
MSAKIGSRERLLEAAARLFEERGYASVTMAELAEQAGVSRPTAYRHFADKEDILWALTEQAGEHTSRIIAAAASSSASPSAQLRTLIREWIGSGAVPGPRFIITDRTGSRCTSATWIARWSVMSSTAPKRRCRSSGNGTD